MIELKIVQNHSLRAFEGLWFSNNVLPSGKLCDLSLKMFRITLSPQSLVYGLWFSNFFCLAASLVIELENVQNHSQSLWRGVIFQKKVCLTAAFVIELENDQIHSQSQFGLWFSKIFCLAASLVIELENIQNHSREELTDLEPEVSDVMYLCFCCKMQEIMMWNVYEPTNCRA